MTTFTNLPLALSSLDFDSKIYGDFKIERSYMDEGWLLDWRKNLVILRAQFPNTKG